MNIVVSRWFNNIIFSITVLLIILTAPCCKKILEIDSPVTRVPYETVFADDVNANAAVAGMYLSLYDQKFAGGGEGSITWVAGLMADEFHYVPVNNPLVNQFENNELQAGNSYLNDFWTHMYSSIYQANIIIEGVHQSVGISQNKKDQFTGEALFIRAFTHFYLAQFFGDVPLILSTDYVLNNKASRSSQMGVFAQVETDLLNAIDVLTEDYPTEHRVRINQSTAKAFLARYYLYLQNWQKAEEYATGLIDNTGIYQLSSDVNSVFLATSREAIWQLKPADNLSSTKDGTAFLGAGTNINIKEENIINLFAADDKRKMNWIVKRGDNYFPNKYKLYTLTITPSTEYTVMFRLAEQYLIRAEARAQQGNVNGINSALSDINSIRNRAGLIDTTANTFSEMMPIIEQERIMELFSEGAHRWLDLKRWNRLGTVLSPIKENWSDNDTIYPIPLTEINKNANLKPQNAGF